MIIITSIPVISDNFKKASSGSFNRRSKVLGSQSLLLSNVQVDDEGEYVCVVENTVGRDEKSAKLVVHGERCFQYPCQVIIFHFLLLNRIRTTKEPLVILLILHDCHVLGY